MREGRLRMGAAGEDDDPYLIADEDLFVSGEELGKGSTGVVFAGTLCASQSVAVKLVLSRPGVQQSEEAQAIADIHQVVPGRGRMPCPTTCCLGRRRAFAVHASVGQARRAVLCCPNQH